MSVAAPEEAQSLMKMLAEQQSLGGATRVREEQERFLLSLLSLGLDRVAAEPERLAHECRAVKQEMESHAVDNYSAFLQSAVCVRKVREDLQHSGRLLHELAAEVPVLHAASKDVEQHARQVEALRKDTQTTAKMHNQVLELLEVPQLMDTAVRNEYYEEALELCAFVRRMQAKFADLPLIKSVLQSVQRSEDLMLHLLLQKLQSQIQLPVSLQVIGVLRRTGRHTDGDLRSIFLDCRDLWLQSAIEDAQRVGSAYQQLCKVTDVLRMNMFEIVTQYRAMFLDVTAALEDVPEASGDGGLLYAWANRRILTFVAYLEANLGHIQEASQLSSILEKVMYCGAYLGREGLDFRAAVAEPFSVRVDAILQKALQESRESFDQALSAQRFTSMPDAVRSRYEEALQNGGAAGGGGVVNPPSVLLSFVPLAVLCNKIMEALNEVRECALVSCCPAVEASVSNLLWGCSEELAITFADVEGTLTPDKRAHFLNMLKAMQQTLLPFVASCVQALFARKTQGLDVSSIAQPLKELLVLEEEAEREAARALAARQAEEEEARKHTEAAAAAALKAAKDKVNAEKDAQRRQAAAEEAKDQADTGSQGGEPGLGPAAFAGESAGEAECGSAADT